jgi:hypothetical protein
VQRRSGYVLPAECSWLQKKICHRLKPLNQRSECMSVFASARRPCFEGFMLVAVLDTFVFWNIFEHCQIPCNHPKHIN